MAILQKENNVELAVDGLGRVDLRRGDENGLAWQATAGIDLPLSDRIDLFFKYRYAVFEDFSFLGSEESIEQHLGGGGFRFRW